MLLPAVLSDWFRVQHEMFDNDFKWTQWKAAGFSQIHNMKSVALHPCWCGLLDLLFLVLWKDDKQIWFQFTWCKHVLSGKLTCATFSGATLPSYGHPRTHDTYLWCQKKIDEDSCKNQTKNSSDLKLCWQLNASRHSYPLTATPASLAAFITSSKRCKLSSTEQFMFFLLKSSDAAPNIATSEAPAFTCGKFGQEKCIFLGGKKI